MKETCGDYDVYSEKLAMTIRQIVDGELWAGHVSCHNCGHRWVACAPWGTATFECPVCRKMDGKKALSRAEEATIRMITALVDVLGLSSKQSLELLRESVLPTLSDTILHGQMRQAIKSFEDAEA